MTFNPVAHQKSGQENTPVLMTVRRPSNTCDAGTNLVMCCNQTGKIATG